MGPLYRGIALSVRIASRSLEETRAVGATLGKLLTAGDNLLLQGALGAGKTSFAQGVAAGMGISAPVTSPTFILVNQYPGPLSLCHIDLYRIEAESEAIDLGLDDYFFDEMVCVVEWPDRAPTAMPPEYLRVLFEYRGEDQRRLSFQAEGSRYQRLLLRLRAALLEAGQLRP